MNRHAPFMEARHSFVSEARLRELATHSDPLVRIEVAQQRRTAPDILALLACDDDPRVIAHAARNKNTPTETLDRLVDHHDPKIVTAVAQNPAATPELLHRIVAEREDVAGADRYVAFHSKTSSETLTVIAARVRRQAMLEHQRRTFAARTAATVRPLRGLVAANA